MGLILLNNVLQVHSVVTNNRISFCFFLRLNDMNDTSVLYTHHIFFVHSSVSEEPVVVPYLGCVNNAAVNMGVQVSL